MKLKSEREMQGKEFIHITELLQHTTTSLLIQAHSNFPAKRLLQPKYKIWPLARKIL